MNTKFCSFFTESFRPLAIVGAMLVCNIGLAGNLSQFDENRDQFITAFNERHWDTAATMFAEDAVFHRMNADTVYSGPKDIVGRFKKTIGGEWNVKFTHMTNAGVMEGTVNNTNVIDSGVFAITAGTDSSDCYAGFYTITWNKDDKIQVLTWHDVQVDSGQCKSKG